MSVLNALEVAHSQYVEYGLDINDEIHNVPFNGVEITTALRVAEVNAYSRMFSALLNGRLPSYVDTALIYNIVERALPMRSSYDELTGGKTPVFLTISGNFFNFYPVKVAINPDMNSNVYAYVQLYTVTFLMGNSDILKKISNSNYNYLRSASNLYDIIDMNAVLSRRMKEYKIKESFNTFRIRKGLDIVKYSSVFALPRAKVSKRVKCLDDVLSRLVTTAMRSDIIIGFNTLSKDYVIPHTVGGIEVVDSSSQIPTVKNGWFFMRDFFVNSWNPYISSSVSSMYEPLIFEDLSELLRKMAGTYMHKGYADPSIFNADITDDTIKKFGDKAVKLGEKYGLKPLIIMPYGKSLRMKFDNAKYVLMWVDKAVYDTMMRRYLNISNNRRDQGIFSELANSEVWKSFDSFNDMVNYVLGISELEIDTNHVSDIVHSFNKDIIDYLNDLRNNMTKRGAVEPVVGKITIGKSRSNTFSKGNYILAVDEIKPILVKDLEKIGLEAKSISHKNSLHSAYGDEVELEVTAVPKGMDGKTVSFFEALHIYDAIEDSKNPDGYSTNIASFYDVLPFMIIDNKAGKHVIGINNVINNKPYMPMNIEPFAVGYRMLEIPLHKYGIGRYTVARNNDTVSLIHDFDKEFLYLIHNDIFRQSVKDKKGWKVILDNYDKLFSPYIHEWSNKNIAFVKKINNWQASNFEHFVNSIKMAIYEQLGITLNIKFTKQDKIFMNQFNLLGNTVNRYIRDSKYGITSTSFGLQLQLKDKNDLFRAYTINSDEEKYGKLDDKLYVWYIVCNFNELSKDGKISVPFYFDSVGTGTRFVNKEYQQELDKAIQDANKSMTKQFGNSKNNNIER